MFAFAGKANAFYSCPWLFPEVCAFTPRPGPHVQAYGPHVQAYGPHVQAYGPHVQAYGPHVQADDPHVQADGPLVQADGPRCPPDDSAPDPLLRWHDRLASLRGGLGRRPRTASSARMHDGHSAPSLPRPRPVRARQQVRRSSVARTAAVPHDRLGPASRVRWRVQAVVTARAHPAAADFHQGNGVGGRGGEERWPRGEAVDESGVGSHPRPGGPQAWPIRREGCGAHVGRAIARLDAVVRPVLGLVDGVRWMNQEAPRREATFALREDTTEHAAGLVAGHRSWVPVTHSHEAAEPFRIALWPAERSMGDNRRSCDGRPVTTSREGGRVLRPPHPALGRRSMCCPCDGGGTETDTARRAKAKQSRARRGEETHDENGAISFGLPSLPFPSLPFHSPGRPAQGRARTPFCPSAVLASAARNFEASS
ncbi:hypothetical protein RJ55_00867 [Drechmeria coniospora]|nr:hypothetical protein RJ55_00867 [Drechmeria coniospora]